MSKQRIGYFDSLKGFAICLVVFCHHVLLDNDTIMGNFFMSFAWAAVPCFFMVTGGLLHRAKEFSWKKWANRIIKVYMCLCVWKVIYLLLYCAMSNITIDGISLIKYLFFLGDIPGVDIGPMWFMNAYLQALIVFPITYHLYSNKNMHALIYLLLLLFMISIGATVINYIGIDIGLFIQGMIPLAGYANMLFYFVLGIILLDRREQITAYIEKTVLGKYFVVLVCFIGIVGAMIVKYTYTGSFHWHGVYLENGYNRLSTMIMAVGLYQIFAFELVPSKWNKAFEKLGKHTMGIFYLHYPVMIVLHKIANYFVKDFSSYYSFALNLLQMVVVIFICTGITIVAKKIPIIKKLFV